MSSAILYLAIVAIWACVLVPRWLRRSHAAPSDPEVLSDQNEADQGEYERLDEFAPSRPGAATDFGTLREEDAAAYTDPVAWEDPAAPGAPASPVAGSYSVTASYSSYSAEVTYSAETADSGAPFETADAGVPGRTGGPGEPLTAGGSGVHAGHIAHGAPVENGNPAAGRRHPQVPMRPPGPAPHVLQARRRTLTMLIAITVAVMGAVFIGLTPWWTAVPPFVLLGMYLLLLHEAAHADAEHAHSWAEAQARAAHARAARAAQLAHERVREAQVASPREPTAEIINISALAAEARDQLYDQYADAEIRAVGD